MEHVYAVLQRDLRRMKVLRMNVEPRARPSRNDISRRKFEGWRMRLFTDESLWYFPQYMCAYIRTCAMYTRNIGIIRFSTDKYRAPFPRCFIAIISHFNFRFFKFKNFKFFRSKNFNNRIENIVYILLTLKISFSCNFCNFVIFKILNCKSWNYFSLLTMSLNCR